MRRPMGSTSSLALTAQTPSATVTSDSCCATFHVVSGMPQLIAKTLVDSKQASFDPEQQVGPSSASAGRGGRPAPMLESRNDALRRLSARGKSHECQDGRAEAGVRED